MVAYKYIWRQSATTRRIISARTASRKERALYSSTKSVQVEIMSNETKVNRKKGDPSQGKTDYERLKK